MEEMEGGTHFKHMAKHLLGVFAGVPGARAYRRHLSEHMFSGGTGIGCLDEAMGLVESESSRIGMTGGEMKGMMVR